MIFFSATRMHSADYAVTICLSARLSVSLSVPCTTVLYRNGIIKLFHHLVNHVHGTSFSAPNVMAIFGQGPITGASNAGGVCKKTMIFDQNLISVYLGSDTRYITLHYIKSYLECPKSLGPLEHYMRLKE